MTRITNTRDRTGKFGTDTPCVLLHPKQSHVPVFLDQPDHLSGMDYYTTGEVFSGTEAKVKELIHTVLEGENKRVQEHRKR